MNQTIRNPDPILKWEGYVDKVNAEEYCLSKKAWEVLKDGQTKEIEELAIDWDFIDNFIPIFIKCGLKNYTANDPWFQQWSWVNILELINESTAITDRGKDLISQYFTNKPQKILELLIHSYRQQSFEYQKYLVKKILKPEWTVLLSKLPPEQATYWADMIRKL